jgi:hypothetical protein
MSRGTLERFAPLTGIVFVVLVVIAFAVGGETPDVDDSTRKVVDFWTENDGEQIAAAILGAWASVFLVWFGGSLRATLRRAEGEPGRFSAISFGGFLTMAIGLNAFGGMGFAAADTAGDVPPAVTQTLSVLDSDFFFILAAGSFLALTASGIAIVARGGLAPWLGYLAIVLGIASLTPVGFFAFLAGGIWILVASVLLFMGERTPAAGRQATG